MALYVASFDLRGLCEVPNQTEKLLTDQHVRFLRPNTSVSGKILQKVAQRLEGKTQQIRAHRMKPVMSS